MSLSHSITAPHNELDDTFHLMMQHLDFFIYFSLLSKQEYEKLFQIDNQLEEISIKINAAFSMCVSTDAMEDAINSIESDLEQAQWITQLKLRKKHKEASEVAKESTLITLAIADYYDALRKKQRDATAPVFSPVHLASIKTQTPESYSIYELKLKKRVDPIKIELTHLLILIRLYGYSIIIPGSITETVDIKSALLRFLSKKPFIVKAYYNHKEQIIQLAQKLNEQIDNTVLDNKIYHFQKQHLIAYTRWLPTTNQLHVKLTNILKAFHQAKKQDQIKTVTTELSSNNCLTLLMNSHPDVFKKTAELLEEARSSLGYKKKSLQTYWQAAPSHHDYLPIGSTDTQMNTVKP